MHSPVRFGLERYVAYRMNTRLLLSSFAFSAATFVIYARFFDILVPFIPGGSVRANSGEFFALPVFLLVCGQTLFSTGIVHIVIGSVASDKKDLLKAYFVSSFQIMLFSIFYALFPYYGPYTYVVYFMPGEAFGPVSYVILVAWTLAIIFGTFYLMQRIFSLENGSRFGPMRRLLVSAALLALIMVTAS